MMVDGIWVDNITCKECGHRHPPNMTCEEAARRAALGPTEAVPCRVCGKLTKHLGTRLCKQHWREGYNHTDDDHGRV